MDDLREIVREEVRKYAGTGKGINVRLFLLLDDENQTYGVNAVDYPTREEFAFAVGLARIVGDKVVIEEDATDRKLIDALLQRGVPRDHIVLAYDGEPEPVP